jgi:hypothetical protein
MQTVLALVAGLLSLGLTGHESGLCLMAVYGVGACVWLGLLTHYLLRSRRRRGDRTSHDRRALLSGSLGLLAPLGCAIAARAVTGFDGLLFSNLAASFTGACTCAVFVAILASSMVDWYLILPFVDGLFGRAVWQDDDTWMTTKRRRGYAKIWVGHRIACEILVFMSLALVVSIVFVAVGNAVSSDKTLPVAIESLGGSGIAFALLTFLGPRVRDSVNYVLAQNAGLGTWAEGVDNRGEHITGLVIDVSVHPGVQLRTRDEARRHVSLANASELQDRAHWPDFADEAWRRRMISERDDEVSDDDRRPGWRHATAKTPPSSEGSAS